MDFPPPQKAPAAAKASGPREPLSAVGTAGRASTSCCHHLREAVKRNAGFVPKKNGRKVNIICEKGLVLQHGLTMKNGETCRFLPNKKQ